MPDKDLGKLAIEKDEKKRKKKTRRVRVPVPLLLIMAGILVVLAVAWFYLSRGVVVQTTTVSRLYPAQVLTRLTASGYVVAQRRADVGTKVTGQLVSLLVEEGDSVKEGQVLARLESEEAAAVVREARSNLTLAEARLREAGATLENAQRDFMRMENLAESGAVSRSEYDAARTTYLAARASHQAAQAAADAGRAALERARVSLSYTEITAPFDAVVLTKNADVGDIITSLGAAAQAKGSVVSIADLSSLKVEADVSESNIGMVSVGQPCDITLEALPQKRFRGVVDSIVPTVDRAQATVLVKVSFVNPGQGILPEMSARVGFLSQPLGPDGWRPRDMVSSRAIVRSEEGNFVFLVKGERAEKTPVQTGERFGDMVSVLRGVRTGDMVIEAPPEDLSDGERITLAEE